MAAARSGGRRSDRLLWVGEKRKGRGADWDMTWAGVDGMDGLPCNVCPQDAPSCLRGCRMTGTGNTCVRMRSVAVFDGRCFCYHVRRDGDWSGPTNAVEGKAVRTTSHSSCACMRAPPTCSMRAMAVATATAEATQRGSACVTRAKAAALAATRSRSSKCTGREEEGVARREARRKCDAHVKC